MRASPVTSLTLLAVVGFLGCCVAAGRSPNNRISVTVNEQARRVDISIDGQPFTSYIWPDKIAKPVLYPLRSAKDTLVTRGYPLEPRPGERSRVAAASRSRQRASAT